MKNFQEWLERAMEKNFAVVFLVGACMMIGAFGFVLLVTASNGMALALPFLAIAWLYYKDTKK
jgi:hypothetical protein